MRKTFTALAASAMLVALVIALLLSSDESQIVPVRSDVAEAPSTVGAAPPPGEPSLFCVFTNYADRSPLVGFYFLVEGERGAPVYVLAFQREEDGSPVNFGGEDKPSPE